MVTRNQRVGLTYFRDEIPFVLEKGTVVTAFGDVLRAAEVEIDGIALVLDELGRSEKGVGIVRAELLTERTQKLTKTSDNRPQARPAL